MLKSIGVRNQKINPRVRTSIPIHALDLRTTSRDGTSLHVRDIVYCEICQAFRDSIWLYDKSRHKKVHNSNCM